jgi:hypothetical protein
MALLGKVAGLPARHELYLGWNPAYAAKLRERIALEWDFGGECDLRSSAAFFAAGHDGGVEAFAEVGGQIINLMGAIDFNGLAGGVERDLAVVTAAQMLL